MFTWQGQKIVHDFFICNKIVLADRELNFSSIFAGIQIRFMKRLFLVALVLIVSLSKTNAQTVHQNSGWGAFFNSTKFNAKWGLALDIQVRTADDWGYYVRNTLFRPGITYYLNNKSNVTAGYMLATTNNKFSPIPNKQTLLEHRIWEQYIYNHKIGAVFAMHRLRLEQRFIETNGTDDIFSQRFRYFFRLIQPLQKKQDTFTKGAFVALQNETFLNIQNKDQLNKSVFDQNRAYLALGYRFSKKFDIEAGYLNQVVKGINNTTLNNVAQLAIYTRF